MNHECNDECRRSCAAWQQAMLFCAVLTVRQIIMVVIPLAAAEQRGLERLVGVRTQRLLDRDVTLAARMAGERLPTDVLIRNAERHLHRFACRNDAGIIEALVARLKETL